MKLPITSHHCIDLDAPMIGCDEVVCDGRMLWQFFCRYCGRYHFHGPAAGHRIAHCQVPGGPYERTGYSLVLIEPAEAPTVVNGAIEYVKEFLSQPGVSSPPSVRPSWSTSDRLEESHRASGRSSRLAVAKRRRMGYSQTRGRCGRPVPRGGRQTTRTLSID